MTTRDLISWLGHAQPNDEQLDAINAAADAAERIYPLEQAGEREDVLSGATQVILGDTTLDQLAAKLGTARRAKAQAMDRLRGAIIAAAHAGVSESEIARRAGVNRMTVRAALGK
ncbi:hypothetical protein GCM10011490_11310 [Pseudoclavibacter endophyticus]|uniref:Uncharacterized protein n=1 Tax=Pseudoclavibacter endophyticus TaxID=1778590 RepID=A0A6H9WJS2_9MICO|nr:hypothetical protein [Pseudoclavibacter endophyticus]KAB1649443.1 hypothetical protein F8O04_04035 [Pseudoclavibacter endophyticus]GGA62626.1 hypothetical protein GCM10011490_11310 [Pseudoclavibacter endophyticus]